MPVWLLAFIFLHPNIFDRYTRVLLNEDSNILAVNLRGYAEHDEVFDGVVLWTDPGVVTAIFMITGYSRINFVILVRVRHIHQICGLQLAVAQLNGVVVRQVSIVRAVTGTIVCSERASLIPS